MTVLEVLKSSALYLEKRGVETPRLNAEHLLAHVLGLRRMGLYLEFERELQEAELAPLRALLKRRGQREPLQHLLGTVEFCGHVFACDKRALVPRPETEELVELVQAKIENPKPRILDVGTGSGVIALSLAAKFPAAEVHAVDLSEEALALARENAARLDLTNRVIFQHGDLLTSVNQVYDLIVANLPYISETDRGTLAGEVLRDPETALFGGPNGDEIIRDLIATAPVKLAPGGLLALEIGLGQAEKLSAFLGEKNYHNIAAMSDYSGVTRFLLARYG